MFYPQRLSMSCIILTIKQNSSPNNIKRSYFQRGGVVFSVAQKLSFSLLQYISLWRETSKKYKLKIIEKACTFICIMANSTYSDYVKNITKAPMVGHYSIFIIFSICTFIISDLLICHWQTFCCSQTEIYMHFALKS